MSNKRFKVPAPPPMLAIRSCIADKAKAVDEARFEALVQTVDQATAMLNKVASELQTAEQELDDMSETLQTATTNISKLQTDMSTLESDMTSLQSSMTSIETQFEETSTKITTLETDVIDTYNTMMENFEVAQEYIDKFDDTIDHLSNIFFPTYAVHFSSKTPTEYIEYDQKNGVHGYLPGNWGWINDAIGTYTVYWYDPITPGNPEPETWKETTSTDAELDGGQLHINQISIYAYWCQQEESWTPTDEVDLAEQPSYTEMPENSITTNNSA